MLTINLETARRFVLGKQGLWPGRRWRGLAGVGQAMAAMKYLHLDPLQIVARSQDVQLLIKKDVSFSVLSRMSRAQDSFHRGLPFSRAKSIIEAMLADGELIEARVDGWKAVHYALGSDAEALADLGAGYVPQTWAPLETSTTEEVIFLAPLDPVSARGRAKVLFGFDYVWELYKPEHQRKFGYYTLPVLWGDRLVARFDSKLDRATNTFVILGLWLEDESLGADEAFAEALGRGFARFITFLGGRKLDAEAIREPLLRRRAGSSD